MNDDAFARRFYADRAELESLGIQLKVDKPAEGYYEAENYSLPPENFYLPAIEFTDEELGALQTALSLLDGEFAYAEPLRLALQQLSWGKPSPLDAPEQRSRWRWRSPRPPAGASCRSGCRRSRPRSSAARRSCSTTTRSAATRRRQRKVDPYHLLYRGGQFYLSATRTSATTCACSALSRIRGKVGYSSKAEHDFNRPEDFDPRVYATRTDWQLGDPVGHAPRSGSRTGSTGWRCATSATPARSQRRRRRRDLRDRLRELAPAGLLGARPRRAAPASLGPPELVDGGARAARADHRAPLATRPSSRARRGGAGRPSRRGRRATAARGADPPRALRPPGHARRHPDRRRPRGPQARGGASCARRSRSPSRSCARTSTC